MEPRKRRFSLHVWGLALGYFVFYAPYSAAIKAITSSSRPVSGYEFLSAASFATGLGMLSILTALGWWKYASRRRLFGVSVPFPGRWTALSGMSTAVIMVSTALAYSFSGVSILLALLLLRGGVLIISPIIDRLFKRRVRWFSWAALALTVIGLGIGFADVGNYNLTLLAGLNLAAYLIGYAVRLPCMNAIAKSRDEAGTRRYLVEEQMVAAVALIAVSALFPIGGGRALLGGVTIGSLYAGLCFFGTLIYLDSRENTFCVPLNRCSSLLSGVVASYALMVFPGHPAPSTYQLLAAGVVFLALVILSPLHHVRLNVQRIRDIVASPFTSLQATIDGWVRRGRTSKQLQVRARVFLFVCGGNTFRSPIAQALCTDEIARKLGISEAELVRAGVRVVSAGLKARNGEPMKEGARQTLAQMGVIVPSHRARQLTPSLIDEADVVYCMTDAQRRDVVEMSPPAASKVECLDPERDLDEPSHADLNITFAEHVRQIIRCRVIGRSISPV